MSQIVLADEINRTSPKTQASLLEVMGERQVTVDDKTYKLEPIIDGKTILKMQAEVKKVALHEDLMGYIIHLVEGTRKHPALTLGASPRATLALVRASQAKAYLEGRNYVIPDDVIKMVEPVLAHRLVLTAQARMDKNTAAKILGEIVGKTKVPIL